MQNCILVFEILNELGDLTGRIISRAVACSKYF
jgi:hypothetical protein